MADRQRLSDQRLSSTEGKIDQVIDSMNGQVRDLRNVIDTVSTQWRGAGAGQFKRAQDDLNMHHSNLQKIMRNIQDAVRATRVGSGANDENVASQMKGIDLNGAGAGNGMVAADPSTDTGGQYTQYSKLNNL